MPTQILATKLHIPPNRPKIVERSQLIDRLNEGLHRKFTLVSAPAGFGKTTLISNWLATIDRPAAWVSLDEEDSDPNQFFTYFVSAIEKVIPGFGASLLDLLQSAQPPLMDTLLISLINELATLNEPIILTLDDLHLIENKEIGQALGQILAHLPSQIHLIITTREDPTLPLARYRARGQMTEIRADDLRFTVAEAAQFLNQIMGLDLQAEKIKALDERTEGWVAGLQLAALSMQGVEDATDFIDSFTGSHHFILDYLLEEVLHNQPEDVQHFLTRTSVLDQLSGPLCDALLGNEINGQATLEYLQQANLFLIPLDNERHWYRYHHLFAELLRVHLMKVSPDVALDLHLRASQWYANNQMPKESIRHALKGEDYERAAGLIEMEWPALFKGHRPKTWFNWVKELPEALVQTRPQLNLGAAWTSLHIGDLESAAEYLDFAAKWLDSPSDPSLVIVNEQALSNMQPGIFDIRIYLATSQRNLSEAKKFARQAIDRLDKDAHYHHGLIWLFLGLVYWHDGDLESARKWISDSLTAMNKAQNPFFEAYCTTLLADINQINGRLNEAASRYHQALQYSLGASGFGFLELAERHIGISSLLRERNELDKAAQHLEHARRDLSEQALLPGREYRWYIAMAQLKISQGELNAALELLDQADQVYQRDPVLDLFASEALKATIWIKQELIFEATGWAQRQGLSIDDAIPYAREFEYLTFARLLVAQGKNGDDDAMAKGIALLNRLHQQAETGGRFGRVIEVQIQLALAFHAQGDIEPALEALINAFSIAEPEGYASVFVDEGSSMAALLKEAIRRNIGTHFANKLLSLNTLENIPSVQQPLIDPLSEREREVLSLIAQGLTNNEIAESLHIAISTVKGHNQRIFEKLQVSRRTEAVAHARELGLL